MTNLRHHIVHFLLNFITIHHFGVWNSLPILLHVCDCVVLHSYWFISVQFLSHTLVWFIVGVDWLRRETANYICKIINNLVVCLDHVRAVSFLLFYTVSMQLVHFDWSGFICGLFVFHRRFYCKLYTTLLVNWTLLT